MTTRISYIGIGGNFRLVVVVSSAVSALLTYLSWKYFNYKLRIKRIEKLACSSKIVLSQYWEPYGLFGGILGKYNRDISWKDSLKIFNELNTPVFYMVMKDDVNVFINDANLFHEICKQKQEIYPKAIKLYDVLRIFGDNIVTTDGAIWRRHRRLTSTAFNDKNNKLVLETSITTMLSMFDSWSMNNKNKDGKIIVKVLKDLTLLTLAIISSAAFGMKINVFNHDGSSSSTTQSSSSSSEESNTKRNSKFKLSFTRCMELVTTNTLLRVLLPKWCFYLPIFNLPEIGTAFDEFDGYLLDVISTTMDAIKAKHSNQNLQQQQQQEQQEQEQQQFSFPKLTTSSSDTVMSRNQNLLSLLVEAGLENEAGGGHTHDGKNTDRVDDTDSGQFKLTTKEMLGNAFIFMLAGHETSAHALSFALILLALNPHEQEVLYKDVQRVLTSSDLPATETHNTSSDTDTINGTNKNTSSNHNDKQFSKDLIIKYTDIDKLDYCNAVMKETLRLFPPVVSIPKVATENSEIVSSDGTTYHVPKDAIVSLHVYALHRNEKFYEDPEEFRPSRWLNSSSATATEKGTTSTSSTGKVLLDKKESISADSFAAFSLGGRSCIGRRFAQIEIVVALAMICQRYFISVPEGVSKEHLLECKNLLTLYPANDDGLVFTERV